MVIIAIDYSVHEECSSCSRNITSRAVASLTVPGGQEFHFPHFSSNFDQFLLFFPHTLRIFFLILVLRVGASRSPGKTLAKPLITRSPKLLDLFVMWFYMFNVEKTKAPEYVSSDGILISLHTLLQHLVEKTISTDTTWHSRPTSTITSQKPTQIHPFLSKYRSITPPSIFGTRLHKGSFSSITTPR